MFDRNDEEQNLVAPAPRGGGTPGKGSTTARLGPSAAAIARALLVQMKQAAAAPDADAGLAAAAAGPQGSGHALPAPLRGRFEQSLGVDLGAVRVHPDAHAQQAATALGARAFAVGDDVFFGAGQYQPHDDDGARLLAHEVAHTVQQGGAAVPQAKLAMSTPGDAFEVEADRAAEDMLAGRPAAVGRLDGAQVQRQVPPTQAGAGQFEAVRACREAERVDARSRARTTLPAHTIARNLPLEPLARALRASFTSNHVDRAHSAPSEGDTLTALRMYVHDGVDLSAPISVRVQAPTGFGDGRDDATYYVIVRFVAEGPAEFMYSNNGGALASQASTNSQASTESSGASVSAPPVALGVGSASSTGYARSESAANSHAVGRERWRMSVSANASWQRRDDFGAANATGWPYVAFGHVGHVEFMEEGPLSPCSTLAGSPSIPTTIAAPSGVGAPAVVIPAVNTTTTSSDTTSNTTSTSTSTSTSNTTSTSTSTAVNTNNNNNATVPAPSTTPPAPAQPTGRRRR